MGEKEKDGLWDIKEADQNLCQGIPLSIKGINYIIFEACVFPVYVSFYRALMHTRWRFKHTSTEVNLRQTSSIILSCIHFLSPLMVGWRWSDHWNHGRQTHIPSAEPVPVRLLAFLLRQGKTTITLHLKTETDNGTNEVCCVFSKSEFPPLMIRHS